MRTRLTLVVLLVILAVIAAACGAPAVPTKPPVQAGQAAERPAAAPTQAPAPAQAPAAAPAATAAKPGAPTPQAVSKAGVGDVSTSPYQEGRMIIKNGDMKLLVADTDVAIDRTYGVAVDLGGYLLSTKSWMQDGFKYATLTIGVPVDQFENAMRRMRGLAITVLDENASGQDVSTEYVDLQSRVTNLEATAARIREFLKQAKDVEESLRVSAELSKVTAEIEQVKGRMTYLKDRAAYSTLTANLEPQRPTLTPTLTPTITPTPTRTPTPTPNVWRPDKTFNAASKTLVSMVQSTTEILIWFIVVGVPCLAPLVALWLIGRWIGQRARPRKKSAPPQPHIAPPAQPMTPPPDAQPQPSEEIEHEPPEPPRLDA